MKIDLIEQLGGYEKAKRELELKEQNSVFQCCVAVDAEMIREALLQYRREHNIFEVGDKVVVITNALGNKFTWEVSDLDGCMVEISQIGQPNEWVHYLEIAHATDSEIQAGRRLEVCGANE